MTTPVPLDKDYFFELFDEFKCVPPAKVNAFITIATRRVSACAWGENATYATALLTAHMIASTGGIGGSGGGAGGALTSESVGEISRSFGTIGSPDSSDAEYLTTRYGAEYVALRNQTIVTGFVTQDYFGGGFGGGCGW